MEQWIPIMATDGWINIDNSTSVASTACQNNIGVMYLKIRSYCKMNND